MLKKLLLIFISIVSIQLSAQCLCSKALQSIWLIDSGAFPMDIVKLKLYNSSTDSSRNYQGYEFTKAQEVTTVRHTTGNVAYCGNGVPYINEGTWSYKRKYIRLKVKGGYYAEGTYAYDLKYKIIHFSNGELTLRIHKTYKNERCETCYK